jgi:hypothetical protein
MGANVWMCAAGCGEEESVSGLATICLPGESGSPLPQPMVEGGAKLSLKPNNQRCISHKAQANN